MGKHITQEVMELAQEYISFPVNEKMVEQFILKLEDEFPEFEWQFDLEKSSGTLARICFTEEFSNETTQVIFAKGNIDDEHLLRNIAKNLLDEQLEKPTYH